MGAEYKSSLRILEHSQVKTIQFIDEIYHTYYRKKKHLGGGEMGVDLDADVEGRRNYDERTAQFNLEDPPYLNTIGVPVGGWATIRFVANNPGLWLLHCHFDIHQTWGMMARRR
ncbi:unnamed protein product [Microthlaspi erraticum]|uniref:Plastocyanin-like domain-containing protein n=1 Tax=Microthlaspi erraticum TaxID=1685480 RepID=A0A6D2IMB0_9BRAS|nr:unnamed protein product [Microthlaspi erraticum]CAA7029036.1 unnamed protein product [Microthlaspi erraticum]CAA7057030.1 unnamed protein product [Microthlaspi erraticum]